MHTFSSRPCRFRVASVLSSLCAAAIAIWTSTGDMDHIWIVGAYYHYSVPGGWTPPKAEDITQKPPLGGYFGKGDPMYVVHARKVEPKDM